MNRKFTVGLALAAGLAGGLLSRYISPSSALAQTQPPREIRAESFVLVDANDNVIGTFRASVPVPKPGGLKRTVVLMDANNQEIWRAGVSVKVLAQK
jgi:hypothetical protein